MTKSPSSFERSLLTTVQMFTPKMRGYAVYLLNLQEQYKDMYGTERLWESFRNGIDRQVLRALENLNHNEPDVVLFIIDQLEWYQYMETKEKLKLIGPTPFVSAQTIIQTIITFKFDSAIVSYLVDRLGLTQTFDSLHPKYEHNRFATVGITDKLLKHIKELQDQTNLEKDIKGFLLGTLHTSPLI